MPDKAFIDTSIWLALTLSNERRHQEIVDLLSKLQQNHTTLFTSNDIIDETVTRLIYDSNWPVAKKFIDLFRNSLNLHALTLFWTDEQSQTEAFDLLEKYSDHKLSLTDATSIIHMKRFRIRTILTLDSDFAKIGLTTLPNPVRSYSAHEVKEFLEEDKKQGREST